MNAFQRFLLSVCEINVIRPLASHNESSYLLGAVDVSNLAIHPTLLQFYCT
jgi:hypothetical protein